MRINAAYVRKSRAEEGESLDDVLRRHRSKLLELAKQMGTGIVDWYEEVVSGDSIATRPQMQALLEAVTDEQYDAVFCMDIDRLGRGDMQDQGLILSSFRLSGTKIITPDKTYNLQDETDETMTEFKAFFARQEYKMIKKRLRRGTIACIQEGGYTANAPFGYEQCRINKKPSLRIIPQEAEIVRLAFDRYCDGVGATEIARELNALGAVPRRNATWNKNSIRYMMRNPVYTGMTVFNRKKHVKKGMHGADRNIIRDNPEDKWIVAPGLHDAIITPEQFKFAQDIRQGRSRPSKQDGSIHHIFAGMLQCSVCGRNLYTITSTRAGNYVACYTPGCCASVKEQYVERYVLDALEREMHNLEVPESNQSKEEEAKLKKAIKSLERDISKLEAKKSRLYDFLEDGTYDKATFMERMSKAEAETSFLLDKLQEAKDNLKAAKGTDRKKLHDAIASALALWDESDDPEKNMLLKSVISKAVYYKDKKTKPKDFRVEISLRNF